MKANSIIFLLALTLLFGCNTTPDVDGLSSNQNLRVFPNPAVTSVSIYFDNPGAPGRLKIFHGDGKVFSEQTLLSGMNELQVTVQSWPEGKYLVVAELPEKNITTQLIKL